MAFRQQVGIKFKEEIIKVLILKIALCGGETLALWKVDQKYLWSLNCDAGEGWKRSFGQNMWNIQMCYKESQRRELS